MLQRLLIPLFLIFAVHPALAADRAPQPAPQRGYLGVWFGFLPKTEQALKTGVIVKKVYAGMAGERAGLKPGEIVTQINGVPVPDPSTAVELLSENAAGEKIRLTVIDRAGGGLRQSYVLVTLGNQPTSDFAKIMTAKPKPPPRPSAQHCTGSIACDLPQ